MVAFKRLVWLAVTFASSVYAKSSSGDSVLVIVEPKKQNDYNIFFDGLRGMFECSFKFRKVELLTHIS